MEGHWKHHYASRTTQRHKKLNEDLKIKCFDFIELRNGIENIVMNMVQVFA